MKQQVNSRPLEILIHIISWGIVFGLPFIFMERESNIIDWASYLRRTVVPFSFLIVFYVNYFIFIPRLLFSEQPRKYIIYNIILLVVIGLGLQVWQEIKVPPINFRPDNKRPLPPQWVFFIRDIVSLIFTIGLSAAIRMSGRWRESETARREAEKSRTEAELKNLRNQLNPHFLLNTLNNIYALISFDTDKAQQAVQELSKLLRHVLYDNQQTYVPLGKEADFIQNYIELMRIRLTNNVSVETQIDIRSDSKTNIAPLIFISLIENAFKHGISPTEPSFIRILLSEHKNEICCEITNSYHPKNKMDKSGSGIGLEQVQKRLELLYPGHYTWKKQISEDGKEYISKLNLTPLTI
ncbi:sensor histidine kinase [uncultured Bacteroides sp.]|uniref:sensor histidine kinase n=1 Tax=uncultured Bacteroides sp. TaxID=162156 RepID=UPI002AA7B358|nr:sensor histidine kinase [uncultured Bacteroides sp.]